MARTEIRGNSQIKSYSIALLNLEQNFLGGSDWNLTSGLKNATIKGLRNATSADEPVTLAQLDSALAGLSSGLEYKGQFDASTPNPNLVNQSNSKGDFYIVSVAGTFLGKELSVGDMIIVNKDVAAGALVAADLDKIDNSESADILRIGDLIDNLNSQSAVKPLSANQGYVLKGMIDALGARVKDRVYSEILAVTHNSPVLPALANTPVLGTVRLYVNGLRMAAGSGNDFTIAGKVITCEFDLKDGDTVQVDYEF